MRYLLIIEDKTSRRMITLDGTKYTIGRHSGSSIILNSRQASRQHATLVRKTHQKSQEFSYWIVDGDLEGKRSHNGIFINGEKCLIHELKDGDLINFGCEINASYHIVSDAIGADENEDYLPPLPPLNCDNHPVDIHDKSTLILSDSHIEHPTAISASHSSVEEDTFHEQAYLDHLTGLPNKTLFNEYLSIALANNKRNSTTLALLLIHFDQFEQINETYGYVIGDQILQNVGEVLNNCVRSSDIVARWSGASFMILLPQLKEVENGQQIQERISKILNEPLEIETFSIVLSNQILLAIYPQDGQEAASLINRLEEQLEEQKNPATSTSTPQSPTLVNRDHKVSKGIPLEKLAKVESRLQTALERKELILVYQPQFNIKTKTIEVMEALLRWQHPQRGLISPRQFFPWLEQTDLILPITEWILRTTCLQHKNWQSLGISNVQVSINLSARQLHHPHLLQLVANVLAKTGLDPHCLELEMTEKTLLQNVETSRQILEELHQLGVSLSLDDFGEGLVSIGHLQNLPIHKLKIEQSWIHQLTEHPENTAMISALIAMGKSFNLRVVAEGVETQQQLEILHNLACEAMQGYRFCQPLNTEQATHFLQLHCLNEMSSVS